ncbi:MAG TPA: nitroreductase family deazaflavin-dependent oxidoreductase [Actinomycetota bacterium]|nr:nitroreductase family deazaflavin-dependent oxidoreductase [Actinomycetota bacterium]
MNAWNQQLMATFRATGGKVGGNFEDVPLLILHTIGAKTGEPRENPLVYQAKGTGFVVFASGGGAPRDPDWFHNLLAFPEAVVEVGTEAIDVVARVAEGDERDYLWDLQRRIIPAFADQQAATSRTIPVVVLERAAAP